MPEKYQIDRAMQHMKIARYLISKADERGKTHGEKHHFHFVALAEINAALYQLSENQVDTSLYDYEDPLRIKPEEKRDRDQIPF